MAWRMQLVEPEDFMELGQVLVDERPIENPADGDVALDEAAHGTSGTEEDTAVGTGEIDAIGHAAGFVVRDDRPFHGIEEIERRDAHRWELDPDSADSPEIGRATD